MKRAHVVVLVLVCGLVLGGVGLGWLEGRESHAVTAPEPADALAPARDEVAPVGSAVGRRQLEAAPREGDATGPEATTEGSGERLPAYAAFLPADLQALSASVPEKLVAFEAATPSEQLFLGRELLAHSIAVILCARGGGPVAPGMPGYGDLSFTGQDGKWSFQVNTATFHFYEHEFPEYAEYAALLRTAYDDQMVPLPTTIDLPGHLAERIRHRAQEALAWL